MQLFNFTLSFKSFNDTLLIDSSTLFHIFGEANRELIFYHMQGECCASAVCIYGLTKQVRIGRGSTWQGCETNFLSLGSNVISLTSIRLTTGAGALG